MTAWARKEAALGDALLRGLQREEGARAGAVDALLAAQAAFNERLSDAERRGEARDAALRGALEHTKKHVDVAIEMRTDRLRAAVEDVEARVAAEKQAVGFSLKQFTARVQEAADAAEGAAEGVRERVKLEMEDLRKRVGDEMGAVDGRVIAERDARLAADAELRAALDKVLEEGGGAAIEKLVATVKEQGEKLGSVAAEAHALTSAAEENARSMDVLTARITDLEANVHEFSETLGKDVEKWQESTTSDIMAAVTKLGTKGREVAAGLAALQVDFANLRTDTEANTQAVGDVSRNLGAVRASVAETQAPALASIEVLTAEVGKLVKRIGSMESQVEEVGKSLDSVSEGLKDTTSAAEGVSKGLDALREKAGAADKALADMGAGIRGVEATVASNSEGLTKLGAGMEELKAHMGDSEAALTAALGSVRDTAGANGTALAAVATSVTALQASAAASQAGLSSLHGDLEKLKTADAEGRAALAAELTTRLAELRAEGEKKAVAMAALGEGLGALTEKGRATDAAVEALGKGLSGLEAATGGGGASFASVTSAVAELKTAATARDAAVAEVVASLSGLKAAAGEREAAMREVQGTLAALKEEGGAARAGLEGLRSEAAGHSSHLKELRSTLEGMQGALKAASNGDTGAAAEVNAQLGGMASRMGTLEGSVGGFTTKLSKELSTVVTSNADMKHALEELQAKTDRTAKGMAEVAAELAEVRARAGGAPPGPAGPAALERDAIVTIVQDSVRPEMAALTKRVKAVESSVKSFSEKLGSDVEVWQSAVNTELQQALTKVKDQLKLHETDVEVLRKAVEERGAKGAEGGGAPVDGEAVNKRLKVVESSVKSFSEKLGADVEAWQKAMNAELQSAIGKVKEQMRLNHEQVTKMADDVASMRSAANLSGAGAGAAADVAALSKRLKAVEESVKTFSAKLGTDVEAWQQAINTELQSALGKVKEQVHKNADAVQKVERDVEALTSGGGAPGGEGAKLPVDAAAAQAALQKRVKVLEATLAAHEMALQAHTETLEAHATWLE